VIIMPVNLLHIHAPADAPPLPLDGEGE